MSSTDTRANPNLQSSVSPVGDQGAPQEESAVGLPVQQGARISNQPSERGTPAGTDTTVTKDLADWLRDSLRLGYLFGCYDEPLDDAGKRVVRAILARLERT
jgi:hypothetical protein